MKTPTISVVIPLYNKAQHIERTIKSVLSQQVEVSEIIVVDDGSTDNGADVVKNLAVENLVLIQQVNQGVSVARNIGVSVATSDYVAFLDADDQWLPFFTQEIQGLITRFDDCGMFATRYQCVEGEEQLVDAKILLDSVNPDGYRLNNYFEVASRGDLPFMVSSVVVSKAYFEHIGGFPVNEPMGEDQDFFANAALQGGIAYSPNIHVHYHRDASNRAMDALIPVNLCPFATRLYASLARGKYKTQLARSIEKYCATHGLFIAKQNIQRGNYDVALSILRKPMCSHRFARYTALKLVATLLNAKKRLVQLISISKKECHS